jgi:hypothetical protein
VIAPRRQLRRRSVPRCAASAARERQRPEGNVMYLREQNFDEGQLANASRTAAAAQR